jgi:hypothetical protein
MVVTVMVAWGVMLSEHLSKNACSHTICGDPTLPEVLATEQPPCAMLRRAMCVPTSEDEQAVSMLTEGPLKPHKYDTRPAATLRAEPVAL